jgi:hypothetical protein
VHPLFWPVLWWSLHRFVARLEQVMELHGRDARISWRVSWYGVIEIYAVHALPQPTWRNVLAECCAMVARACAGPVGMAEQICGRLRHVLADPLTALLVAALAPHPPAILDSS